MQRAGRPTVRHAMGFLLAAATAGCNDPPQEHLQGYAEGEYVRVASPFAGQLAKLAVKRGDQVKAGEPLFTLEQENEAAQRREAADRLARAQAQLENLRKAKRPTEIDAVRAELAQAEANLKLAEANLKRQEDLYREKFVSGERLFRLHLEPESREMKHLASLHGIDRRCAGGDVGDRGPGVEGKLHGQIERHRSRFLRKTVILARAAA